MTKRDPSAEGIRRALAEYCDTISSGRTVPPARLYVPSPNDRRRVQDARSHPSAATRPHKTIARISSDGGRTRRLVCGIGSRPRQHSYEDVTRPSAAHAELSTRRRMAHSIRVASR